MKIDTTAPRLPIDRLNRPLNRRARRTDEPEDLLLDGKDGEELDEIVRKLYDRKIKKRI